MEHIARVTRYAGGEDPQLSRLGGGEWQRARTRVRKAVRDLAKDLLALYAARANVAGRAFGDDTPGRPRWRPRLRQETDQLRAILEVKADLERPTPMDRIVVGDVGYGKTEVAIRAAFKAVQEGCRSCSCPRPCSQRSISRPSSSGSRRTPERAHAVALVPAAEQ
ncbi:MAG: CarD family transcriptional regulator [Chloroflexota bacterium]